jgi:hypothetical protein
VNVGELSAAHAMHFNVSFSLQRGAASSSQETAVKVQEGSVGYSDIWRVERGLMVTLDWPLGAMDTLQLYANVT